MKYIHGFDPDEQRRLIAQAAYWRARLLFRGIEYRAGESVLEIGCGVGAVLAEFGDRFPGVRLAGIDIEPVQVDVARDYLAGRGTDADVRLGDGTALPWAGRSFDHVYMIWVLEHVRDPMPFLLEALRVLKPGGTIALTETDYPTFGCWPLTEDFKYLAEAQRELFERNGNAYAGRALGAWLNTAGFREVRNAPAGFHHFTNPDDDELRQLVEYISAFLEPMIPQMVEELGRDEARLRAGMAHYRGIPERTDGAATQIVYRATGTK